MVHWKVVVSDWNFVMDWNVVVHERDVMVGQWDLVMDWEIVVTVCLMMRGIVMDIVMWSSMVHWGIMMDVVVDIMVGKSLVMGWCNMYHWDFMVGQWDLVVTVCLMMWGIMMDWHGMWEDDLMVNWLSQMVVLGWKDDMLVDVSVVVIMMNIVVSMVSWLNNNMWVWGSEVMVHVVVSNDRVLILLIKVLKESWVPVGADDLSQLREGESTWQVVGGDSQLWVLVDTMVTDSWSVVAESGKVLHDCREWRWLLLEQDLVMVHDCAVPVDESPDNSLLISVSDTVLHLKGVDVLCGDQSVQAKVIIDNLMDS